MGPIRFIVYLFPVLTIAALFYFFVWYWQATRTPLQANATLWRAGMRCPCL